MLDIRGYGAAYNPYGMKADKKENLAPVKETEKQEVKKTENKLSEKASNYLEELRKTRSEFDFVVAGPGDDYQALAKNSTKEYTVILTAEEVEKMASDKKYAADKMSQIDAIVAVTKRIMEQEGFASAFGEEDTAIKNIGVSVDDNGNVKLFASLEKASAKQRERIAANRERRAEERKEDRKKAEEKRAEDRKAHRKNPYEKDEKSVKEIYIEATSASDLAEKIKAIDWESIPEKELLEGGRFDFSV